MTGVFGMEGLRKTVDHKEGRIVFCLLYVTVSRPDFPEKKHGRPFKSRFSA
jgi:hypothetical protein